MINVLREQFEKMWEEVNWEPTISWELLRNEGGYKTTSVNNAWYWFKASRDIEIELPYGIGLDRREVVQSIEEVGFKVKNDD